MKVWFIAAAAAVSLGACATPTTLPPPETLAQLKSGKGSALIFNFSGDVICDSSIVGVYHPGATKNDVVTTNFDYGYKSSQPVILSVPPGRYRLSGASCMRSGYYPGDYPALPYWFDFVDVGENEVVYAGTIDTKLVDFQTSSAFNSALARLMFAGVDDKQSTYVGYKVTENPDVKERVSASHPDLAKRVIYRPFPQRISQDEYMAILKDAFAPGADGVPPTREAATAKFRQLLVQRFGGGDQPPPNPQPPNPPPEPPAAKPPVTP